MALGDGIGRNKGVKHWVQSRQNDYYKGARDFIEWLLSNNNRYYIDFDLAEDFSVSLDELLKRFQESEQ